MQHIGHISVFVKMLKTELSRRKCNAKYSVVPMKRQAGTAGVCMQLTETEMFPVYRCWKFKQKGNHPVDGRHCLRRQSTCSAYSQVAACEVTKKAKWSVTARLTSSRATVVRMACSGRPHVEADMHTGQLSTVDVIVQSYSCVVFSLLLWQNNINVYY